MAHSAAEGTLRQGDTGEDAWSRGGGRSGAKLSCVAGWQRGGRRRRPEVTSARGRRTDDEAADRWGRSASGSERARESDWQVGSACQREREGARSGLARARRQAGSGPREEERGREGGELRVLGRDSVQRGRERVFPFYFLLFKPHFPFLPLFLLNKIFCEYSKCLESRI
jgi:hypothetical protein